MGGRHTDRVSLPQTGRTATLPDVVGALGLGVVALVLLRPVAAPVSDPDVFWHIRLGQALARTWDFGPTDPLSDFTQGYVYHQWLPELAVAVAEAVGGLALVSWTSYLLQVALMLTVYAVCRRVAAPLPSAVVTGLVLLGSAGALTPRPQLVGLILLAVTAGLWQGSTIDGKPRWVLIPLAWVWACSHGSWVLGLGLGALTLFGLALDRRRRRAKEPQGEHADRPQAWDRRLGWVLLGCAAASLATPVGPRLVTTLVRVAEVSPLISEWRPMGITDPRLAITVGLFLLAAGLPSRVRATYACVVPAGFALAVALASARSVAMAAVILAPLAASRLGALVTPAVGRRPAERAIILVTVAAALALAAPVAVRATQTQASSLPSGLAPALNSLPTGSVVVTSDAIGGWLGWAHPGLRATWDTRAEAFGADYVTRMAQLRGGHPSWSRTFDSLQPAAVLVEGESALVGILERERGWRIVGHDAGYVLLLAPRT